MRFLSENEGTNHIALPPLNSAAQIPAAEIDSISNYPTIL
jgi:hypothetical protein